MIMRRILILLTLAIVAGAKFNTANVLAEIPSKQHSKLAAKMVERNLSIAIEFRQRPATKGALFSIYAGQLPILLITSRQGVLMVEYLSHENSQLLVLQSNKILHIDDNRWRTLYIDVNKQRTVISVDCQEPINIEKSELNLSIMSSSVGMTSFMLGHQIGNTHRLKGEIRSVIVESYSILVKQCGEDIIREKNATLRDDVNTAQSSNERSKHWASNDGVKSEEFFNLKIKVAAIETKVNHWRTIVNKHDRQIAHLMNHQRGCKIDDIILDEGDQYTNHSSCQQCLCSNGLSMCAPISCPVFNCLNPFKLDNECCPKCGSSCVYMDEMYHDGEIFYLNKCTRCTCTNGQTKCRKLDPTNCPKLDCAIDKQMTPPNHCCPICLSNDACENEHCHVNATCEVKNYKPKCVCREGFWGNGKNCFDIDECSFAADVIAMLEDDKMKNTIKMHPLLAESGGTCGSGARCVNTDGAFECHCLPGFVKLTADDRHCYDMVGMRY